MIINSNEFSERLVKSQPKAKLYCESLESVKAEHALNMVSEFSTIILAGDAARSELTRNCMRPLTLEAENATIAYNKAKANPSDVIGNLLGKLQMDQAVADNTFMEGRLGNTMKMFISEAARGQLAPNEQLLLPLQYLGYLKSTFRYLVPFENVDRRSFIRQRVRKKVKVTGGKEYTFPEALKDKTFMAAVLGADNRKRTVAIKTVDHPSSAPLDLLALFNGEAFRGKNKIAPVVYFKSITTVADGKIVLGDEYNAMTDIMKKGDFSLVIKKGANRYHLSGQVDFDESMLDYQASPAITEFEIELSLYSGSFQRGITAREVREQYHVNIDESISGTFSYNHMEVLDKLTFEHTDMVVSAAEIMNETIDAAKDYYGYSEMDKFWDELKSFAAVGSNQDSGFWESAIDLNMDPAMIAGNPGELQNTFLNTAVATMSNMFRVKLNVDKGFTTNMWTNLEIGRVYGPEEAILTAGDSYAGTSVETTVRAGSIKGRVIKLVETQREDLDSTLIKFIPQCAEPEKETFKFLQWETKFINDNSYRDVADPSIPSIHILDNFKLYPTHQIMGRLHVLNKDKSMGVVPVPVVTP